MGIAERWRSLRHKMVREPLPPEDIAAGWALGVFVGCAIPFGVQLIVSVPLAMMMRVSKIGATVGTLVSNPVSIWFIYPAQTMLAAKVLGRTFPAGYIAQSLKGVAERNDWHTLLSLSRDVTECFLLGGLMLALVLSPIAYFAVKAIVMRHRKAKKG